MHFKSPPKRLHYALIFDSYLPDTLLDASRLAEYEQNHGVVIIVCRTLQGLSCMLAKFPITLAVIVSYSRPRMATAAFRLIRKNGVRNILRFPDFLFPVDFFEQGDDAILSGESVFSRPFDGIGHSFMGTWLAINWPDFLDREKLFALRR